MLSKDVTKKVRAFTEKYDLELEIETIRNHAMPNPVLSKIASLAHSLPNALVNPNP